jgi:hypothetical protein
MMMTKAEIRTATRDQLADELAAAGEYTEDWKIATMDDLRHRVRLLVGAEFDQPEGHEIDGYLRRGHEPIRSDLDYHGTD